MWIGEEFSIKKPLNKILKQIDKNDVLKIYDKGIVKFFKSDNINEDNRWYYDTHTSKNISALFEHLYIDRNNENYDILYYKIISPKLEEKASDLGFLSKMKPSKTKKFIKEYRCNILKLKKNSFDKYKNKLVFEHDFIVSSNEILIENSAYIRSEFNLKQYYRKVLEEGLIKTYSIDKTEFILKSKLNITENDIISYKDDNGQHFSIRIYPHEINKISEVNKIMNTYGWFMVNKEWEKIFDKSNTILKYYSNEFEPRYDLELSIEDKNNDFYHLTPSIYWDNKISKIGLSPRSKNKVGEHPERVYLTYNVSDMESLMSRLFVRNTQDYKYKKNYSVLKFEANSLKLYVDKNYVGGVYTVDNIPVKDISEVERYLLDEKGNIIKRLK
jgi:hypothetical protein